MNPTPEYISNFIRDQFPEFYREINGNIVDFVLAYYEWLETEGQNTKELRGLKHARDIDSSVDKFTENFKKMFLAGTPLSTKTDSAFILKHVSDLYQSKGSSRSIELLLKILYNQEVSVFLPSDRILRPSNTKWIKPQYIELSTSDKTKNFAGKQITGGTTGVSAFCESVIQKSVNRKKITIAYITGATGSFSTGEIITSDGFLDGAPIMIGSLSNIELVSGGQDFKIGDIFDIESQSGRGGQAKVTEVANLAGRVNFKLSNGGYGFTVSNVYTESLSSNTTLIVNTINNVNSDIESFFSFENVIQPIQSINIVGLGSNVATKEANISSFFVHATNASFVNSFSVDSGGSNYNNTDIIEFTTGNAAASIITNGNGSITSINVTNTGSNYIDPPRFEIVTANGAGANISIVMGNDNFIQGVNSTSANAATGYVVANSITANSTDATGNLTVITTSGNFDDAAYIHSGTVSENVLSSGVANIETTGRFIGTVVNTTSNVIRLGIDSNTNIFYAGPGTFIKGVDSNTFANVTLRGIYTSGADFEIGGIGLQENLTFYSDIIGGNNTQNVVYTDVTVEGRNANIGLVESITVDTELSITGLSNVVYHAHHSNGGFSNGDYIYSANVYVNSIFIAAAGTAYDNNDTVSISGNATASLLTTNTGAIAALDITSTGAGYSGQATITISTSTGSGANVYAMMGASGVGAQAYIESQNATDIIIFDGANGTFSSPNIITNGGVNAFATVAATNSLGGSGYDSTDTITISGGGGAGATATLNVQSNVITSVNITDPGSGYDTPPTFTITTGNGSGANLTINMDYGVGLPASPSADDTTILADALSFFTANIGEVISFSGINPGAGYSLAPVPVIRNPYVAAFNRRDFIARTDSLVGFYQLGERLAQNVDLPGYDISIDSISNTTAVVVGEGVRQNGTEATGIVESINATMLNLKNTVGAFNDANDVITLSTNAVVTPASSGVAQSNGVSIASGTLKSIENNGDGTFNLKIRRLSFGQSFIPNATLTGASSGAISNITHVTQDPDSLPIGFNAVVTANVQTANGVATGVEIINSGYGYEKDTIVNLVSTNSAFISTGLASIEKQGTGPGRWISSESFLNDTARIQDSDYYQEYSYSVQTGSALDKYSGILKDMLHVAGFKLFGEVINTKEIFALNVGIDEENGHGSTQNSNHVSIANNYQSWMN